MLTDFNKLKNSKEFLNWKSKNKNAYLASCFIMIDKNNSKGEWQFDFYLPPLNKMTSFIVNDEIKMQEEQEIFKKSKTKIKELKLSKVKIKFKEALEIINKKYKEKFVKKIIILQNSDKTMWNISLLNEKLDIININIDAVTGKIFKEKKESLLKLKAR